MIHQLIHDAAQRSPGAPALLAPGFAPVDYHGLDSIVAHTGAALAGMGIEPGSTVALLCPNGLEAATAFLGVAAYTACAPLNPTYTASEFELYLADLAPAAVVVQTGFETAARGAAVRLGIPVVDLATLRAARLVEVAPSARAAGDVALLLHTSGTTSRPKLVPLTHANLIASAEHIAESLALRSADRCLNIMPLFHIHGLAAALLASLSAGGSVVCCPGFSAPDFFGWLEQFRPTWYTAVPAMHQAIVGRAKTAGVGTGTAALRFIRSCSSPLPPSLMHELETLFQIPVIEAYGMTEAAHQMTSNPLPPGARKPGSVGVAAGPEVAIMDDDGLLAAPRTPGEVVIRGPNVALGYVANPDANAASFVRGWFRTGDLGHLDADGYLFLSGRRTEMINRGGEKIAPREVDEALLAHPAVARAVAVTLPHAQLGEAVGAAVVLHDGERVTARELREFVARRLAAFKVPEQIVFLDELPTGPTGKVQRIGLAARLNMGDARPRPPRDAYVAPQSPAERLICDLFASTLGRDRVGMCDHFFDLGGDSLLTVTLLARVAESTGAEIPFFDFAEAPTPRAVCAMLHFRPQPSADRKHRVVIRTGPPGGPALFCVPGSHGNVAGFFHLSRSLGDRQTVTAFRLPAWQAGYRVEDLAKRYAAEVMEAQPDGPYHLLGVCTGGLIAFEMARRISAAGGQVGLLALLDCHNLAWAARLNARQRWAYELDLLRCRLLHQGRQLRAAGFARAIDYLRPKLAATLETSLHRWQERLHHARRGHGASDPRLAVRLAAARYVPPVWSASLDLFRVEEPHVDAYNYPQMGWLGVAQGDVVVHEIGGSHLTLFEPPHVESLAATVLERIHTFKAA